MRACLVTSSNQSFAGCPSRLGFGELDSIFIAWREKPHDARVDFAEWSLILSGA